MNRALITETLRRPRAVWWVVLVALCFVLAPTLNRALAFAGLDDASRVDICTAQGSQTLLSKTPDTRLDTTPEPQNQQPHCPFCLHQADRFAPPPHRMPYLSKVSGPQQEIPVWQAFFVTRQTPRWAPPRGPPHAIAL